MSIEIIEHHLKMYKCKTPLDEINALKEITQEIALMALSKADFFKFAEFHGGTALRILYGMQRFSEDLDFALLKPIEHFKLTKYLEHMVEDFEAYGYKVQTTDRKEASKTVQKQFLKVDSLGNELSLAYRLNRSEKKIKIKFELDTNPPAGAKTEIKYLTFPLPFSVVAKDLPSLFAGKLHALLCRSYEKGRDWYDFIWFISNRTSINYELLSYALQQQSPWAGQPIQANKLWITKALKTKIIENNWDNLVKDVMPLLKENEQASLKMWGETFFLDLAERI